MAPAPTGVLLAAGAGTRFGGGKLLHPLPPLGLPMAVVSYRNLRSVLDDVVVVIRAGDAALAEHFRAEAAQIVFCEDAHEGMGRSLSAGIGATRGAAGWIVALGDMPAVATETIRRIAQAIASGATIAAPACDGRRGHPVGFAAALGHELSGLRGDEGARHVVSRHAADVDLIPVEDPGIHADIDTREDVGRLLRPDEAGH